jgi:hypothetical protein
VTERTVMAHRPLVLGSFRIEKRNVPVAIDMPNIVKDVAHHMPPRGITPQTAVPDAQQARYIARQIRIGS